MKTTSSRRARSRRPSSPKREQPPRRARATASWWSRGCAAAARSPAPARAASPLRLLLPDNHGHAVWAYTTSYGGGLVDGDALSLAAHVAGDAALMLAPQASTKVFRGAPGVTESDLLVINKTDLAPHVGADLGVMARDARLMRKEGPTVFAQVTNGVGVAEIIAHLTRAWRASRTSLVELSTP